MQAISRRSFLKLTGATAAAVAGTAMLSGCGTVRTVTVIATQGGVEINRTTTPMPSFVTDLSWAIGLMKPLYIANLRSEWPELGNEVNNVTFEADPDVRDNGRQVQDENGNWTMTLAVRSNLVPGIAHLHVQDGSSLREIELQKKIPIMDTWTVLPDTMIDYCVKKGQQSFPANKLTLTDRADNGLITRSAGTSPVATLYVQTDRPKEEEPDNTDKKDDTDKEPEEEMIVGNVEFYDYDVWLNDHTCRPILFVGRKLPKDRLSLTTEEINSLLADLSANSLLGQPLVYVPRSNVHIARASNPPTAVIFYRLVNAT